MGGSQSSGPHARLQRAHRHSAPEGGLRRRLADSLGKPNLAKQKPRESQYTNAPTGTKPANEYVSMARAREASANRVMNTNNNNNGGAHSRPAAQQLVDALEASWQPVSSAPAAPARSATCCANSTASSLQQQQQQQQQHQQLQLATAHRRQQVNSAAAAAPNSAPAPLATLGAARQPATHLALGPENWAPGNRWLTGSGGGEQLLWCSRTLEAPAPPPRRKPLASVFGAAGQHLSRASSTLNHNHQNHQNHSSKQQQVASHKQHNSLKRLKSARHASYQAMRTIDMYLVRQVAHSCMDFEMEQKIDLEIRVRELAAQSLLEARTELEALEVEKSLLASDKRMNCYALHLEQQRKQLSNHSLSTDSGRGSKGAVSQAPTGNRPDVVGGPAASSGSVSAGSPHSPSSLLELSSGGAPSPSKLSPVSGESANSESASSRCSRGSRWRRTGLLRGRASSRSSGQQDQQQELSGEQRARNRRRAHLLQTIHAQSNINTNLCLPSRASVSLSELRIPLMWRDVDHFKQRGDYKRYAVFCLLRAGSQIYDTQLISDVDRQVTDVTFDDVTLFRQLDHEFELHLEVYSCVYLEHFSLGSTPRKLKEKLTSSVSRAMGRRLATHTASANYTKELQAYQDQGYRFAMIASAVLRLEHASQSEVKTYDLVLVSPSAHNRQHLGTSHLLPGNTQTLLTSRHNLSPQPANHKEAHKNTLPLFGHFCCRLAVRPEVFDRNIRSGYLRVASVSVPNNHQQPPILSTSTLASSTGLNSAHHSPNALASDCSPPSTLNSQRPHFSSAESVASKLRATKMASMSMSSSQLYWAVLRNFSLQLWAVDERRLHSALARNQLPVLPEQPLNFNIDRRTRLLRVSNSSITLETDSVCLVLAVYPMTNHQQQQHSSAAHATSEETGLWLRCLEQYIYDSHIWHSVLEPRRH